MSSKLQSLLKEKINENIKAHSTIDKNFAELDIYKVGKLVQLPIENIEPNPAQPRLIFDESQLRSLADSIEELGLLQPIIVRPSQAGYEIVAGERRYRACKLLNKKYIDAIIIDINEENNVLLALAENLSRADLTDFEIATSISQFKDSFPNRTEYAKALGLSRQKLYKLLAFDALPETVLDKIKNKPGLISADTAEKLSSLSKNTDIDENSLSNIMINGVNLVEAKTIKQVNLIDYIQGQLIDCPNSDTNSKVETTSNIVNENSIRRVYQNQGKTFGKIKSTHHKLLVEIDIKSLNEDKQIKIENFFDNLFSDSINSDT